MRVFLHVVLPLLAPIMIYAAWSYWEAQRKGVTGAARLPSWEEGNWFWAIVAGVVLTMASLGFLTTEGSSTNKEYSPPYMKDGRIVPGQHK